MKGADTVMSSIVQYNDWLEEEVMPLGRGGLSHVNSLPDPARSPPAFRSFPLTESLVLADMDSTP